MRIKINGEIHQIEDHFDAYPGVVFIHTNLGEFYIAEDAETAGQAARKRWADMARDDPEEFTCLVGTDTLVSWALGQRAGPGTAKVESLNAWLDVISQYPEEEFATFDGSEQEVERVGRLVEEIGFTPTVAYQAN